MPAVVEVRISNQSPQQTVHFICVLVTANTNEETSAKLLEVKT